MRAPACRSIRWSVAVGLIATMGLAGPVAAQAPQPSHPASAAAAVSVPAVAAPLRPGEARYAGRIELPDGQTMAFTATRQVEAIGDEVAVTETAHLPMGEVTDRTLLAADTLVVRKRSIVQGTIAIEFAVAGGHARGQMSAGGEPKAFDIALDGDLFADGAGAHLVVGALPLAPGYQTAFRNLDLQTQSVKVLELEVVGEEPVTVPAGTFDAYKVELVTRGESDRTTLWVRKPDRELLKASAVVPRMNGAVVTTELQP